MAGQKKVLIIGAGASGLMAAAGALKEGAAVTVLEHNLEAGKKLLLTGNGRCNYTNTDISAGHYCCDNQAFIKNLLEGFTYGDCIAFFRSIGIEPMVRHYRFDESGYVYPSAGGARALRDALYGHCLKLGADFRFGVRAEEQGIAKTGDGYFTANVTGECCYDSLIIAAGSNAFPHTGSDSSVYPLLVDFRLGFAGFVPALCALYTRDKYLDSLKGVRRDSLVTLMADDGTVKKCFGEVQYNAHSISGIPVMQLSNLVGVRLKKGIKCSLIIDGHSYEIYRTAGFERAQCCMGGIGLSHINPDTLESLEEKGIYICGELLDITGDCGGYNLHLAWASGYRAGVCAAV